MKSFYLPGEPISDENIFVKGHGTHIHDHKITSSTFGYLTQINKVIFIEPHLPLRYTPQIGDIIVARVLSINNKKWILSSNSTAEISMSISAIMLKETDVNEKYYEDEIAMRDHFDINDVLCAQVQRLYRNGNVAVHSANEKFGKLCNGICVQVPILIVERYKTQFFSANGVDVIVGMNGFVWIGGENKDCVRKMYHYVMDCKVNMKKMDENMFMKIQA